MARGFAALSPAERTLMGRAGAHLKWAKTNSPAARREGTKAAREGLRARWARELDPDGQLPQGELEVALDHRMTAHMAAMTLRSAQARSGKGRAA